MGQCLGRVPQGTQVQQNRSSSLGREPQEGRVGVTHVGPAVGRVGARVQPGSPSSVTLGVPFVCCLCLNWDEKVQCDD